MSPIFLRASQWLPKYRYSTLASLVGCSLVFSLLIFFYRSLVPLLESNHVLGIHKTTANQPIFDRYLDLLDHGPRAYHPIDELILESSRAHDRLLRQQPTSLRTAASYYRQRRGRHPPPGFDKWFEYARGHDSVIIEQFFDRIEHDIRPFWARDAATTAAQATNWEHVVRVRSGVASGVGNVEGRVPWLELWTNLVAEAAQWLPDVDMPINYMDESRILVRWDEINGLVQAAELGKSMPPPRDTTQTYRPLAEEKSFRPPDLKWVNQGVPRYWDLAREACAPSTPARDEPAISDFSEPPVFPQNWGASYAEDGFVKNYSASMDPCTQPHLRGLHGTFVEPVSISTSQSLMPLFGGCKLPMNNDILIPGAMYLTDNERYSGGDSHGPPWAEKDGGVVWRGVGSGGRHKKENWTRFQRLRLIQMLNASTVSDLEHDGDAAAAAAAAPTFDMPSTQQYPLTPSRRGHIGEWLSNMTDAGFIDLLCFPRDSECDYLSPYFSIVEKIPMKDQFQQKFLPDVDGNSFSARFRSLLLSTSLPLKSTIYAEWHDDRLLPWLHFAPLDNTLRDLYAVLDYFTADEKGDTAARLLAESGKAWSEKVLRREDMLLYVWRLLLEFARVCDEDRDRLGFVGDLLEESLDA